MAFKADVSQQLFTTIIEPERGLGRLGLRDLWQYRDLIRYLLWRNIHGRYRPMSLGLFWIVITPFAHMLIYNFVFGILFGVGSGDIPYPVFVYSGLALWLFFQSGVNKAVSSLAGHRHMMNKVYFPRMITPLVSILTDLVDFGASFIPLLLMLLYYRITPSLAILTLPFFVLMAIAATTALGLWLAALSVNVPDVAIALPIVFRAWMYLSPIVYPITRIPERWRSIYYLNPMAVIFQGYRWALLGGERPPDMPLLINAVLVMVGLVAALYYFRHTERTMVDFL